MTRPDLHVVKPRTTAYASLIRTLTLLAEGVYPADARPEQLSVDSYKYGFNTGARGAYADVVNRLRELQSPDEPKLPPFLKPAYTVVESVALAMAAEAAKQGGAVTAFEPLAQAAVDELTRLGLLPTAVTP